MLSFRYTVLDPNTIYNIPSPSYRYKHLPEFERQIRTEDYINRRNRVDNFYTRLEQSILKEGFRNPIIVYAGWIPIDVWKSLPEYVKTPSIETFICCWNWGGSRLYFAQKHNLPIPCIINDFTNLFPNAEELCSVEDILNKFTDPPTRVKLTPKGIMFTKKI